MATRRTRCTQCGRLVLVPLEAHYGVSIKCWGCQSFPQIRPHVTPFTNNNNYAIAGYGRRPDQPSYHQQQPRPVRPQPLPMMVPPSPYGKKRAVLFGISYGNRVNRLKGSVNDVQCMKYFLINKLGFPTDSIRMLTGTTTN